MILIAQMNADPFSKFWMIALQIYGHIKYFTARHADKFALRVIDLIVHSAQYTFFTLTLIVLNKAHIQPCHRVEVELIKTLVKETPVVLEYFWFQDQYTS